MRRPLQGEGNSQSRVFEQGAVANGPPRGRLTFSEGQRPVIELSQTADASAFINLFGHQLLDELMRDAAHPQSPDSLRRDARTVLKWLGVVKPDAIETKHYVQFARAVERYVMEGHAPSGALAPSLAILSESLTRIYGTPQALNVALNDDIRGVFNRMFAMPPQIANWTTDCERQSSPVLPTAAPTHQIGQSELLYWSETIGCGATMKLRSDEICMVSVARSGVLVKASRMGRFRRRSVGFFAAVLYNEKDVYKAARTALALDELFLEKRVPVAFRNPILSAYANAIWQCSSAAEVAVTLNEAIAKAISVGVAQADDP
jgi:hypothetical protein